MLLLIINIINVNIINVNIIILHTIMRAGIDCSVYS